MAKMNQTVRLFVVVLLLIPALVLAQVRQRWKRFELETHLNNASKQLAVQLLGKPTGISKLGDLEILVFANAIDDLVTPHVFLSIKNGVVAKITYSRSSSLGGLKAKYTKDEFQKLVMGKDRNHVISVLGRPLDAVSSGDEDRWYYRVGIYDPTKPAIYPAVLLTFRDGVVKSISLY